MSSFLAGGTSYFVPESDLSTLFEDWALVRPTDLPLVPRVVDMLFQRYRSAVDRLVADGFGRRRRRGGRRGRAAGRCPRRTGASGDSCRTAPLAAEMKTFIDTVLDVHIADGYGTTEVGAVTRDGVVMRPPVIDYKLVDVPELGYFLTDKPYPRGELLVKTTDDDARVLQAPRRHRRGVRPRRLLPHRRRDGRDRAGPAGLRRPEQERAQAVSGRVRRRREAGGDLRRRTAGASDLRLRQQRASQPARGDRADA